jgi:hypothetical protein
MLTIITSSMRLCLAGTASICGPGFLIPSYTFTNISSATECSMYRGRKRKADETDPVRKYDHPRQLLLSRIKSLFREAASMAEVQSIFAKLLTNTSMQSATVRSLN